MNTSTLLTLVLAPVIVGLFIWSVQRIIGRIDQIGHKLEALGNRVTVIETKQDAQVDAAIRTDKVTRKTAAKVGVRLPKDLEQTIDPRRVAAP